jgi:hypothetical protein
MAWRDMAASTVAVWLVVMPCVGTSVGGSREMYDTMARGVRVTCGGNDDDDDDDDDCRGPTCAVHVCVDVRPRHPHPRRAEVCRRAALSRAVPCSVCGCTACSLSLSSACVLITRGLPCVCCAGVRRECAACGGRARDVADDVSVERCGRDRRACCVAGDAVSCRCRCVVVVVSGVCVRVMLVSSYCCSSAYISCAFHP